MASYLGKISAIVSANTAGYVRSLNDAAAQTRSFAQIVQRDIARASKEADKSFNAILTPLQRLQRSLEAATSQRNVLAFKGIEGTIQNVEQLRQKINEIKDLRLAVDATGLGSIDRLRDNLKSLSNEDIQAAVRVTGSEDVDQLQRRLNRIDDRTINLLIKAAGASSLDDLSERISDLSQTELRATVQIINENAIANARRQFEQLASSSREISGPLSAATAQLDKLALGVQASLLPGFSQVQQAALNLENDIRSGADVSEERYERVRSAVERAASSIQAVGGVDFGDPATLKRFVDQVSGSINPLQAAAEAAKRFAAEARALPLRDQIAFTITGEVQNFDQARSQLSSLISQVGELEASQRLAFDFDLGTLTRIVSDQDLDDLPTIQALISRINDSLGERRELNIQADQAQQQIERVAQTVSKLRQDAAFVITGKAQNIDQIQSELNRILGTVSELSDSQRSALDFRVQAVIDAIGTEDIDQARAALERLKTDASTGVQVNLDAEQAKQQATELASRLNGIRDTVEFTITGRVQNFDQARQELSSILAEVAKLDEAGRTAISPRVQALGELVASEELSKLASAGQLARELKEELASTASFVPREPLSLGPGLEDSSRYVEQLKSSLTGLESQLETLPKPIRAQFLPELDRLRTAFARAASDPARFGDEVEKASADVQKLSAQVQRIGAAQGLKSFADGLDDSALRGAIGNLQALEQILNRVGATAGSEAAAQFDRMRAAIQRATDEGTIGSEAFQNELRQIAQEAANAAAATGKIRTGAAFREIQRGGDIARGGFDKLSLGLQQAAFAIDDFFSATGDISQKIRAVQNNVTQLAFVVGETKGLFIGLGVAIAAQATVALIKWLNAGVEAKDRTEALNQALARQKSLVEELKTAFESLTDSLTRGIFSDQLEEAIALGRELDGIRKKAEELRKEQAAALDPAVNQERALQTSLQKRLDEETDVGQRIALERQIAASRRRENSAADAAVNRQVDADEVGKSLLEGIDRQFSGRELDEGGRPETRVSFLPVPGFDFRDFTADFSEQSEAARRRFEGELNQAGGNPLELARILESRLEELASRSRELDQSATPRQAEREAINEQIVEIERNLQDLEAPVRAAILDLGLELLEGSAGIRDSLGRSREIIDSSLGGFGPLAREQDKLTQEYKRIQDQLRSGLDGSGKQLTQEGIKERERELEALRENASGLESAARSTEAFAEALDRVASNLADTVLGEARSAEEQARRERNRRQAELDSLPADATPAERQRAERDLFNAQINDIEAGFQADQIENERRRIRADRRRAEEQFQRDARAGNLGADLQRDIAERDRLQRRVDSGEATADERNSLDRLEASIARLFETSVPGRDLARRSDELDQQQQRNDITRDRRRAEEEQRRQSVDRGQELLKTPQQQAAEQGLSQFDDAVNASLSNVAAELQQIAPNLPELADGILSLEELGGLFSRFPQLKATLEGEFLENLQTARDNIAGNVSEQIAQFDEERSKVSRQAIQAQDVNTQQGRAELNRMLRGDDANRDKPILQGLEKQLTVLNLINERIEDVTTVIGTAGP